MTEEVTDAMCEAGRAAYLEGFKDNGNGRGKQAWADVYLAMRSASNSPTTNGEVSEPRQTHCADPDCAGPKPHVAETAGCKWGNPRAASDDEAEPAFYPERLEYEQRILATEMLAERLKRLIEQPNESGSYVGDTFYPVGGTEASHEWDGNQWRWCAALTNHSDLTEGKK